AAVVAGERRSGLREWAVAALLAPGHWPLSTGQLSSAMVMAELPKARVTNILKGGDYLNPGETVSAGVPTNLSPWSEDYQANRLGLARWLTHAGHPLTARVAGDRFAARR